MQIDEIIMLILQNFTLQLKVCVVPPAATPQDVMILSPNKFQKVVTKFVCFSRNSELDTAKMNKNISVTSTENCKKLFYVILKNGTFTSV